MGLEDLRPQLVGQFRHVRSLKRAGGDDDLVGGDRSTVHLEDVPAVLGCESPDGAVQRNRELKRLRVLLQIGDHLVAIRIAVGIAGEGKPRETVVAAGREQG
jgi:hypothetical protein